MDPGREGREGGRRSIIIFIDPGREGRGGGGRACEEGPAARDRTRRHAREVGGEIGVV